METDSLKLNFEIALERIDTLSDHNQKLMDKIQELESKLNDREEKSFTINSNSERFEQISEGADKAIQRYKTFLNKEFINAKSKQSKRQSVWERNS